MTTSSPAPRSAASFWSLALPLLGCAACPLCSSAIGGLVAGAGLGLVGGENWHGGVMAVVLIANVFVLRAAQRRHGSWGPLALCLAGGASVLLGHFAAEWAESLGFGLLMLAGLCNLILLRRSPQGCTTDCCAHESSVRIAGVRHEHG